MLSRNKGSRGTTGVTVDGVEYVFHGDINTGSVWVGDKCVLIVGDGCWEFLNDDQDGMSNRLADRVLAHF